MSYDLWSRLRYVLSPQFDIYEKVAEVVSRNVLDVGCGTGFGTHLFTRSSDFVLGIDIDSKAVKFAERTFSNHSIKFNIGDVAQDIVVFDSQENKYDFVTMIDVIEHIRNDGLAVRFCKEQLKKDGKFICSTPNRLSRYRKSDYHVREYAPEELWTLLKRSFENVDIVDHKLEPVESEYENPIIAICM